MNEVLGVVQRGHEGAWVHLEVVAEGVQITGARSLHVDTLDAVVKDGVESTSCHDVATVLWSPDAAVGAIAPDRAKDLSRRKLFNAALAIGEQNGYDPKHDDVRVTRHHEEAVFAFGKAKAISLTRSQVKGAKGRLRSLQIASAALSNVLPEPYEVAVLTQGATFYVLLISSGPTRLVECATTEDVSAALLEAARSGYVTGHLTPIATMDETADARLCAPDRGRFFESRGVERYNVPQGIVGIGTVALGAGYGALANA